MTVKDLLETFEDKYDYIYQIISESRTRSYLMKSDVISRYTENKVVKWSIEVTTGLGNFTRSLKPSTILTIEVI